MDYSRPIETLIPGARGRILRTVLSTDEALPLGVICDLAGVSVNQVPKVIGDWEELGIVKSGRVGKTTLVQNQPLSLVTEMLTQLLMLKSKASDVLVDLAKQLRPAPISVVVFGSFARGDSQPGSDIDVALLVKDRVVETDEWADSLQHFVDQGTAILGLQVSPVIALLSESVANASSAFWDEVVREQVVKEQVVLAGKRFTFGK